jgi:hypothetical protein
MLRPALPVLIGLWLIPACRPSQAAHPEQAERARRGVMEALDHYLAAAKAVDPVRMSAAFTSTGVLFEPGIKPIESRDSIRAFLASFPGATVESVTAVPDTIEVYGTTAYLWGSYFERLTFPGQPRSEQHGRFVIEWLQQPDSTWQIHRYFRVPVPTPPGPQ